MGKFINLTGKKFSDLTVISRSENIGNQVAWNCICDCGNKFISRGSHIRNGLTKSCGCRKIRSLRNRLVTHGMASSREYKSWQSMHQRCTNPNNGGYKNYGGRGISVCERWAKFDNFYADMGIRPSGTSLDRINNDGNYEPSNCRWVNDIGQARNRRNNKILSFQGRSQAIDCWAKEVGIPMRTLQKRINRSKWTIEKALTTPIRTYK